MAAGWLVLQAYSLVCRCDLNSGQLLVQGPLREEEERVLLPEE